MFLNSSPTIPETIANNLSRAVSAVAITSWPLVVTCLSGEQIFVIVGYTDPERTPRSEQLDNSESINRACADMKLFNQEVLRVILLDTRYRHSSTIEITKGSINESLAYPRDIFRPVIGQSAYAFVLVHNL